jgi:hypothetical protein
VNEDGGPSNVSAFFFMHDAHGAADTVVRPCEKSAIVPGRAITKAATAAAEAAEAAVAERTRRRRSACVRSSDELTGHSAVESWNAVASAAISRDHDLHGAHPSR